MNNSSRRGVAIVGLILLAAAAANVFAAEGSFQRTLSVSGQVDLEVNTGSGDIRVRTGGSGSVQVAGLIKARDDFRATADEKIRYLTSQPPIEQTGNVVRIGRVVDDRYRNNVSISYEIITPPDTRLRAGTGSGDIRVDGIQVPVDAHTGSGDIRVSGAGSDVRARTGSGSIEVDGAKGAADLSTGSGNIRAGRIGGGLKVSTGSGDVVGNLVAPGDVAVSTGSGSIEVDGVKGSLTAKTGSGDIRAGGDPSGIWSVRSSSGGVHLRLASNAAFDLDAHTSSGGITVNHPITMTGVLSKKAVKGKVRGGGALIEVQTSSGDIVIQ